MQKSKNTHKAKVKIAKHMNVWPIVTGEGYVLGFSLARTGHFLTQAWQDRKEAIARRVANKISKIKLAIQKKNE